ncbi:MAG: class I SAM-dependent methyltransferase [Bacilli bacterium]|nr:class I SAM-dependent methyltransferase [Bacilli bacterium]
MPMISKLELANDLINGRFVHYTDHYSFQRLYPFCNENVSGYMDFLNLEGKSVLTVGSSADQAISAIARGSKDITVLDICPFTEDYFYLKKSAIETIDKKDFERLLFYKDYPRTFKNNRHPFALKDYPELLAHLQTQNEESHNLWLTLSNTYSGEIIRKNLFTQDEEKPSVTRQLTDYLKSEKTYLKTRERLAGVTPHFINANITHGIPTDKKFDTIILSNLTTYLNLEEIERLLDSLIPHLNDGGQIMLGYMYRTDEYSTYQEEWDVIYHIDKIKGLNPDIEVKSFQGVKGVLFETPHMKDAVYVYQKKR